jgi:hypothetical protein
LRKVEKSSYGGIAIAPFDKSCSEKLWAGWSRTVRQWKHGASFSAVSSCLKNLFKRLPKRSFRELAKERCAFFEQQALFGTRLAIKDGMTFPDEKLVRRSKSIEKPPCPHQLLNFSQRV